MDLILCNLNKSTELLQRIRINVLNFSITHHEGLRLLEMK